MRTGFIYGLICPIENEIKYIGQSFNSVKKRLKRHIKDSLRKKGRLTKKEAWIKSLDNKGLVDQIVFVILEECEIQKLNEQEIIWIAKYGLENLKNISEGGSGVVLAKENHPNYGKSMSEETKKKIGEANSGKNNGMYGRKNSHSIETRDKMSFSLKNSDKLKLSRQDPEYRKKISDIQSCETAVFLVCKETNEVLGEWKNCHELSKHLSCTYANIKNARRDHRPIGKRISKLGNKEFYVIYKRDFK